MSHKPIFRKLILLALIGGISLTGISAHALQIRPMVDQERLTANISNHELNRIMVEGDRIAQVFGTSGLFVIETDETQGQVFIRPTSEVSSKPFTVTVVTEAGLTQDLLLTPQSISAETILIKAAPIHHEEASKWETASPYKETLMQFMQAMAQNHPLPGYGIEVVAQPLTLWRDLQLSRIKIYKGAHFEGSMFEVTNRSLLPLTLSEKQFLIKPRIAAIAIKQRHLEPGQRTQLFMVKHV